MATVTADSSNFESTVLQSDKPVVVDFWAPWCGPCKQIAPDLEAISDAQSAVTIAKVNIDENPDLAQAYGVRSIPMMVAFKGGEAVDMKVGAAPRTALESWVKAQA